MINSSDLIYNTNINLENNDETANWIISRYLNIKPSDYSFPRQDIEINLFSYVYDDNNDKIFTEITNPTTEIFIDLLPLFSYTTLTLRVKNSNEYIPLDDSINMSTEFIDQISILNTPIFPLETIGTYIDENYMPYIEHDVQRYNNTDDETFNSTEYKFNRTISNNQETTFVNDNNIYFKIYQNSNICTVCLEWTIGDINYHSRIFTDTIPENKLLVLNEIQNVEITTGSNIHTTIDGLENDIQDLQGQIDNINTSSANSIQIASINDTEINDLSQSIIDLQQQIDGITTNQLGNIQDISVNRETIDIYINDIDNSFNMINDQLNTFDISFDTINDQFNIVDTNLTDIQNDIIDITTNFDDTKSNLDLSFNIIFNTLDNYETKTNIDNEFNTLVSKNNYYDENIITTNDQIDDISNNLNSLNEAFLTEKNDKSNNITSINGQLLSLSTLVNNTSTIITNKFPDIDNNERRIETLEDLTVGINTFDLSNAFFDFQNDSNTTFSNIDATFETFNSNFNNIDINFNTLDTRIVEFDDKFIVIDASFNTNNDKFIVIDNSFNFFQTKIDTFDSDFTLNNNDITVINNDILDISQNFWDVSQNFWIVSQNFLDISQNFWDVSQNFYTLNDNLNENYYTNIVIDSNFSNIDSSLNEIFESFNIFKTGKNEEINTILNYISTTNTNVSTNNSDISTNKIDISTNKIDISNNLELFTNITNDILNDIDNVKIDINARIITEDNSYNTFSINFNNLSDNVLNISNNLETNYYTINDLDPLLSTVNQSLFNLQFQSERDIEDLQIRTINLSSNNIEMLADNWQNKSLFNYVEASNMLFNDGFYIDTSNNDNERDILIRNNGIFTPRQISGDISLNGLGTLTILNDTITNDHIPEAANIDISKTTLQLGNGLEWDSDGFTLINSINKTGGVEATIINSLALNTYYFNITDDKLDINDVFILNRDRQILDGNLCLYSNDFINSGLFIGTSDIDSWNLYDDNQTNDLILKNTRTDTNVFMIDNNNNISIQTNRNDLYNDNNVKLQVGGNVKIEGDLIIDEINSGIRTTFNSKSSLFIGNGEKFVERTTSGDISLNEFGEFNIIDQIITNDNINDNAFIDLSKLKLYFNSNEFNTNMSTGVINFKTGVVFRNDQGQNWEIETSGMDEGSFKINAKQGYNNFLKLYCDDLTKVPGVVLGQNANYFWKMYKKTPTRHNALAFNYSSLDRDVMIMNGTSGNISIGYNLNEPDGINPIDKLTINGNIKIANDFRLIVENSGLDINYNGIGNDPGNILIGNGTIFIPQTITGAFVLNDDGFTTLNKVIDNDDIIDNANIDMQKINFNPGDKFIYDENTGQLDIADIYVKNDSDEVLIQGNLTLNKNSETLILKGISDNNGDPGPNIFFYKSINEIDTSSIGYQDNSQQIFKFNAVSSNHIWNFNTNIQADMDIELTNVNSKIIFNDNNNKKILMSDGSGYKPQWISDGLSIDLEQFELIGNDNTEKTLTLKSNGGGLFATTNNGVINNLTLNTLNDDENVLTIQTQQNNTTNNNGCKILFNPTNTVDDYCNIGFGQQSMTNIDKSIFKFHNNIADGGFSFNKNILLYTDDYDKAGPNIILNPALGDDNNNEANGILFKTNQINYDKISASIKFSPEDTNYKGGLSFFTNNDINFNTGLEQERMRIDMSGNIGINRFSDIKSNLHIGNITDLPPNSIIKQLCINTVNKNIQYEFNSRIDDNGDDCLDINYNDNNSSFTLKSNSEITKVGINDDNPESTFSISSMDLQQDVSMSIISTGKSNKASLFFGTNDNAAMKTSIISQGIDDNGKSNLHFCLSNSEDDTVNGNTTTIDTKMIIQNDGFIGIGTQSPSSLLDVYSTNDNNVASFASDGPSCNIQIKCKSGIDDSLGKSYIQFINEEASLTDSWNLAVNNDQQIEFDIIQNNINENDGNSKPFIINANGNIGIGMNNNEMLLSDKKIDISGTCRAHFYEGDGRYINLDLHPLLQEGNNNLHNYHSSDDFFICKFLCYGNFAYTVKMPLVSKRDIVARESGAEISELELWGSTNEIPYYIFRPWESPDKAFEINNIVNVGDIIVGGFDDNYYENWSISMDISMNKNMVNHNNNEWVALLNIDNDSNTSADIYLLDGQIYVKGNGWDATGRIGDGGNINAAGEQLDIVEQETWTTILLTFRKFRQNSLNFVEITFYKNGRWVGEYTPESSETERFRLKNTLLLFNEKDSITDKINRYTGYGWVKNITLYKKTLNMDEAEYVFKWPERGLGLTEVVDSSTRLEELEALVSSLTERLNFLENS